ncbi:hypothetical protein Efla_001665 [Eimeria flavescens]
MRSSPLVTLLTVLHAANLLSLLPSQQNEQGGWQVQAGGALFAAGSDPTDPEDGGGDADGVKSSERAVPAKRGRRRAALPESSATDDVGNDPVPFDLTTIRRLVDAVKQAADAATGAAAVVEAVHQDMLLHKQDCEARSRAVGEEIGASFMRLQALASGVSKASDALVETRSAEFAKFVDALAEAKHSQDWPALAQRQEILSGILASVKKGQEDTARDLQMLNSSYLSLDGNIQDQLKRVEASTADASAANYKLLAERLGELADARVAQIQRAYNNHRLDELAVDRSILDMIQQLKRKGVAVLDISDVFPNHGFEAVRKEFMVRVAKRIRAFFLPVFIVTQTQEEFSDWLYTRYHLVPSMRMIENIIDELSFINDREAYAVVRVESVLTDVIIRRAEPHEDPAPTGEADQDAFAAVKETEERQKMQVQSLTQGKVLSFISQPSQESLVVARGPFFGAEVVKKFDLLTKAYLRTMVGGHLSRRAVLIVYMGDRKGKPTPSPQEVIRKLDMAEKLCNSFSAPAQEVAALWRQMEAEIPFYSIFFRVDPVVFDTIPVSFSFEQAKLPPLPPSPLFRGEFGVVQLQALLKKQEWYLPSSRALQSVVSYVNSHQTRGGVQAIVSVVEEKVTGFWRSKARHSVKVTVRSADAPSVRLRLAVSRASANVASGGSAKEEVPVVALGGQEAVQQYLTQAIAKVILPSIGARASFRRLLLHICIIGKTCQGKDMQPGLDTDAHCQEGGSACSCLNARR